VLAGEAPLLRLTIEEYGARFVVDLLHGQKTGFYLDQRETRRCLGALAPGRRVLNGFAYTGAFAVVAARAGAREVVSVDTSRLAPGGWLLTSSCSQHLPRAAFREVVAAAAADARRIAQVVGEWGHPADHPVLLAHPEGEYLKVLLVRA